MNRYVVIGCSAGCSQLLETIIKNLGRNFSFSVVVVRHRSQDYDGISITKLLSEKYNSDVREPLDKERIESGIIYMAPAGYHLMVEQEGFFSLSTETKVNFSRPSIDLLFNSMAETFKERVIGILLSGANSDGTEGLKKIKNWGGVTIVQDPLTAEFPEMPQSGIKSANIDYIMNIDEISIFLSRLEENII